MMDQETWTTLAVGLCLALLSLSGLLLKDYFANRERKGLPYFPDWIHKIFWVTFVAILAFGSLAPAFGYPVLGMLLVTFFVLRALWRLGGTGRSREQAEILLEISEAMRHRLSLVVFLNALGKENREPMAARLQHAAGRLSAGASLGAVLDEAHLAPPHVSSAVRAIEACGGQAVPDVLQAFASNLRKEIGVRAKLLATLLYPLATWAVCVPMALFLYYYAFPKYTYILRVLSTPLFKPPMLPPPLWWTMCLSLMWILVLASSVTLALVVGYCLWDEAWEKRRPLESLGTRMGHLVRKLAECLPLLRGRYRHRSLARTARTLGALAQAGVNLPAACRRIAVPELAGPYTTSFARLAERTDKGVPLREALKNSGLPESFVWLAVAGAAGGNFPDALVSAAEWHETKARRLDALLAAALPCLTIPLAGLLVGSTFIATYWAILSIQTALIR